MAPPPFKDRNPSVASQAYRAALSVVRPPRHHLDAREQPYRPADLPPHATPLQQPGDRPLSHRVDQPGWTGFKLGFGFAAGGWAFRAILHLILIGLLLIVFMRTMAFLFG